MRYKNILSALFFVVLLSSLSRGSYALQTFNYNYNFPSNYNGYYIADMFWNASFIPGLEDYYSCFNVSGSGKMILTSSNCALGSTRYDLATLIIKMLPNNAYYKMADGDYLHMEGINNSQWCDQPETSPYGVNPYNFNVTPPICGGYSYIVLPKNMEGIVALNYTISDNLYIDGADSVLSVWENGVTELNSTPLTGTSGALALYIPPAGHDRNITIFAGWHWLANVTPIGSKTITINRFQFYAVQLDEIRLDWNQPIDYQAELNRYCGVGSVLFSQPHTGRQNYRNYTNSSFIFGNDPNGVVCGLVRVGKLVMARHWDFYIPSFLNCNIQYSYWTPNMFFVSQYGDNYLDALWESFNNTMVRVTVMAESSPTGYAVDRDYASLSDGTRIDMYSFRSNYSNAMRQWVSLVNNPNINISTQFPGGVNFTFTTDIIACSSTTLPHPFFTQTTSVNNSGWYCVNNGEFFIAPDGTEVNDAVCGECGCQGSGHGFRCIAGTDHWECIYNNTELRHYTPSCVGVVTQLCDFGCANQQCIGQNFCSADSDCAIYCDTPNVYYNPYCHKDTGVCDWTSSKKCAYGCNQIYNDCNPKPILTGVVVPVAAAYLGFDVVSTMLFLAIAIALILSTLITFLVSFRGGFGAAGIVFGITFIAVILIFSMINPPWVPPIAMVLLLILAGMLVVWQFSRMAGGGY